MGDFEKLMEFFASKSYADLVMPFFELIAIATGLLLVRKQRIGVFFLTYLAFDFCIWVCNTYIESSSSFSNQQVQIFIGRNNCLIAMIELLVYCYFFSKILQNKIVIRLLKAFAGAYVFLTLLHVVTPHIYSQRRFFYITNLITVIEFLFLIPPCLTYFKELFRKDPSTNLYNRPSFWIVVGIFFYAVISIPYYMLDRFLAENESSYWSFAYLLFFSIPFSINFLFLTKAFLCKKLLTI